MNAVPLPPPKESDFLNTAAIVAANAPHGEIVYFDFVGFDHEKPLEPGYIPEISIRKFSKVFHLEKYRVAAEIDPLQSKMISDLHGVSMRDEMISVLLSEDEMNRENVLYKKYEELSELSRNSLLTEWQKKVKKWFNQYKPVRYVLTGEDVMRQIMLHANYIAVRCRRGQGNFAIVSAEILCLLEDTPAFTYKQRTSIISMGLPVFELVGSFNGIDIFRNCKAKFNDRNIIVGRTTRNNESGVYFASTGRELMEMADSMTLKTKIAIDSRIEAADTVNADKNFTVFEIEIGKKPWWKKLFKL
jgi:hypothetical protein